MKTKVLVNGDLLTIEFLKYNNNRIAIELIEESGEPYAMLSVNIPDCNIEPDEIIIKDYSENSGIPEQVFKCGLFENTGKFEQNLNCPIWKLK